MGMKAYWAYWRWLGICNKLIYSKLKVYSIFKIHVYILGSWGSCELQFLLAIVIPFPPTAKSGIFLKHLSKSRKLFSSRPFHLQRHSMHPSMHVFLTLYYVALCCVKFQYIWLYLHKIILHTSTYIWRFVHEHFANLSTSDQTKIFGCNCPEWFFFRLIWPPFIFLCHGLMWLFLSSYISYLLPIAHRCLCLKKPPIVPDICLVFYHGACCQGAVDVSSTHRSFNWLSQIHAWLRWPHPRCANLRGCCGCWLNSSVVML